MVAFPSNWLILFPIAFSLFVAMRLSEGSVDQGRSTLGSRILRYVIAILFWFALLATGLRPNFMTVVWIGMMAVFGCVTYWKSRRLERSALLMTALGARNLSEQQALLGFFFDENVGWVRRKAGRLRRDVAVGVPWGRALETRRVATGVYERLMLRLRAKYGPDEQQGAFERESYTVSPMQVESEVERLFGRLLLFSWGFVFIPIVVALIMTFIIPTFKQMFEEFGMALPAPTLLMIQLSDWSVELMLAHALALVPLFLLALVGLAVCLWLCPSLLLLPLLRWFGGEYYRNVGFVALANVIHRERDLVSACRETANIVPVDYVGQQYHVATRLLQAGSSPADAFLKSRLISRRELEAFGQGFDTRDPTWGLRQLAGWKTERMLRRYSIIVQLLVVAMTLVFAAIVGLVAVGVISALSAMVVSLG